VAQEPIDRVELAREKRGLARRARRLAHTLVVDEDRMSLLQFAAELDTEAEALEGSGGAVWIPPVAAPNHEVQLHLIQQQQVQQQQSAEASIPPGPKRSE
jgi:hypothetical protein